MAGIFGDYQFDPSNYSGGAGILGLLGGLPFNQQVPQGFPDQLPAAAVPAMGTVPQQPAMQPPPQAPATGLAGLIGSLFGPSQANAQPAMQQPMQQPQGPGMGDRAMAALANFSNSHGLLPALTGAITGGLTGQRTDPLGILQAQQAATYHALVSSGVPQGVAQAAALNPEVLKTIAPELYQKPQLVDAGQDPLSGMKFHQLYNPNTQQLSNLTPQGGQGNGPGMPATAQQVFDQIEQARNAGATQEQLLQTVPNSLRSGVQAMLQGGAIPTNLSNRGAARDLTLRFAHAIDPTFDESLIPARVALQKDYQGGGKAFEEVNALNTVSGHMEKLKTAADAIGNSSFKPFNVIKNMYADTISGSPELVRFRNALVTTQNELAKAYHGGHVSDAAYNNFNKAIGEAQTPAELKAAIGELADLLGSKITARENAYKAGMNGLPLPGQYRALNDEAQKAFKDINQWSTGTQQAAPPQSTPQVNEGATATNPKTGQRIIFKGGQWQPVQ